MRNVLILMAMSLVLFSCENSKKTITSDDGYNTVNNDEFVSENDSENDETVNDSDEIVSVDEDKNDESPDIITPDKDSEISDEEIPDLPVEYESGFIEIEPVSYKLDNQNQTSGSVRMWYNFQPADVNPSEKPLFVFFNGGPGAATALLFSYNTSKMTADQAFSEIDIAENEFNWNQIGNLLYIDARMTGFSYGLTENPSNQNERSNYFKTNNFNVFIDAADFIRVILRFLDRHPDIQANKVILAGESYGGTRATAMLNILLNVRDYAVGNRTYFDQTLFDEIDAHFMEVNPEMSALPHKEVIKQQFAGQVLIQPLVAGDTQFEESGRLLEIPGSPIYDVESETGVDYKPCSNSYCEPHNNALQYLQKANRDMYSYRRPYNWLFDYSDIGAQKTVQLELYEKLTKNDLREIDWLYAGNREKAFRYPGGFAVKGIFSNELDTSKIPASIKTELLYQQNGIKPLLSGNFEDTFGALSTWDEYFIDLNQNVTQVFYYASTTPYSSINGDMFLENIRDVKTFITSAEEDIIIYAPGLPESLKKFNGVSDVVLGDEIFTVKFSDNVDAVVTFPFYPESPHSVSIIQPEMFFNDVKAWMNF